VTLTATVHFAFIAYVVTGGFVALKWRRTLPLHVAAVVWGLGSAVWDWPCPLTSLERWARAHAGMAPLPPDGFIAHYLTGVLYPADAVGTVRLAVAAIVVVSWVCFAVITRLRR
jgi:hypothetical protein